MRMARRAVEATTGADPTEVACAWPPSGQIHHRGLRVITVTSANCAYRAGGDAGGLEFNHEASRTNSLSILPDETNVVIGAPTPIQSWCTATFIAAQARIAPFGSRGPFAVMDSLQQRNPATAVIVGAGYIGPDAKSFVLHPSPRYMSTSSLPVVDSADQQFGQPLADGLQLEAGKIPPVGIARYAAAMGNKPLSRRSAAATSPRAYATLIGDAMNRVLRTDADT